MLSVCLKSGGGPRTATPSVLASVRTVGVPALFLVRVKEGPRVPVAIGVPPPVRRDGPAESPVAS